MPDFGDKPPPKPHDIKAALDRHVIGQDAAKRTLAVATYNHFKIVHHNIQRQRQRAYEDGAAAAGAAAPPQEWPRVSSRTSSPGGLCVLCIASFV